MFLQAQHNFYRHAKLSLLICTYMYSICENCQTLRLWAGIRKRERELKIRELKGNCGCPPDIHRTSMDFCENLAYPLDSKLYNFLFLFPFPNGSPNSGEVIHAVVSEEKARIIMNYVINYKYILMSITVENIQFNM